MKCKLYFTFFIMCLVGVLVPAQTTIRVAPEPKGTGDGSSWQNASSIENAIAIASDDDEIWIKEGAYIIKSTLQIERTLKLYGGYAGSGTRRNPANFPTVLSGGGKVVIIRTYNTSEGTVFDGLTFIDGFARSFPNTDDVSGGGALHIGSDKIKINNCIFRDNISENRMGSGAIYLWSADDILIRNSVFKNNRALQNKSDYGNWGGGVAQVRFGENTVFENCRFVNNSSYYSGGVIDNEGNNTQMINCHFENNRSEGSGGVIDDFDDNAQIINCTFKNNQSEKDGGAIYTISSTIKISNSTFQKNISKRSGGGIYSVRGNIKVTNSIFQNNRTARNGGAIYNGGEAYISNCTFVNNTHTALAYIPKESDNYSSYLTTIYNSIFYKNTAVNEMAPDIAPTYESSSTNLDLDFRKNILQTKKTGFPNNLVGENPQFADAPNGYYELIGSSPAIDAGNNGLYRDVSGTFPGASKDLSGNDRLQGERIDMGAYEFSPVSLNCATNVKPADNATDVPVDTDITWNAVHNADGYYIAIGTSEGGNDIVDNEKVTEITYRPENDLAGNTTYYVTVTPYNNQGSATGCTEISFTTETAGKVPECTDITGLADGSTEVPLTTDITWEPVSDAEGYYLFIGTSPGGAELVNREKISGTSYTPVVNFEENTTYYVSVVPFNETGKAKGCEEISFTTETLGEVPGCTEIISPVDGQEEVPLNTDITWESVPDAEGYYLSVGTSPGGAELVNEEAISGTSYTPAVNFEENTTHYVSVIPFNETGEAEGCTGMSFTTETLTPPSCAVVTTPVDGTTYPAYEGIGWEAVEGADSYRIYMGTTPGGTDVANGLEPGEDFKDPDSGTYYLRVIPYNEAGEATGCKEITFSIGEPTSLLPGCTEITSPANGDTDVAIDMEMTWETTPGAQGYYLSIGTSSGGAELLNREKVSGTSFMPAVNFEENTTYYVSVVPFNESGEGESCEWISFTTEALGEAPGCTEIISPVNNQDNVPLNTEIIWKAVPEAEGYHISIGTSPGGSEVLNGHQQSGTTYSPETDFEANTTYYIRIIPYNSYGTAESCPEFNFTIHIPETVPECTLITGPADGSTAVPLAAGITWEPVPDALGYYLSIGTSPGGAELVNREKVGGTSFTPSGGFEDNTTYYVGVIPFNETGEAEGCTGIGFTTETLPTPPACTTVVSPADRATDVAIDTDISWNAIADADGYYISIGTTVGGADIIDHQQVSGITFSPDLDFEENTTYYVTAVPYNTQGNATGCTETSFTTRADININKNEYGFSPNGDGINDSWKIEGIENYPDNTVSVYNRWGDMVFRMGNYDNHSNVFTGVANKLTGIGAGKLPSGTYFFDIRLKKENRLKTVKGFLVLRR